MTTWNPSDKSASITLSGGNLIATGAGTPAAVRGTTSKTSKVYYEVTVGAVGVQYGLGVADSTYSLGGGLGGDQDSAGYYSNGFIFFNNSTFISGQATYTTGDIIGVAIDQPNNLIYFSKNGTYQNSAVPASGTGGVNYISTAAIFAAFQTSGSDVATVNFGATSFNTAPPTGFSQWDAAAVIFPSFDDSDNLLIARRRRNIRNIPI